MRCFLLLLIAAALAAPLAGETVAPPAPVAETRMAVPRGHGRQVVIVVTREFPVGGSSGWHTHPGIEIGHVVSGVTEMRSSGNPPRRYGVGERFVIPRGLVHNGVNIGQEPARLVITYIVDERAPLRRAAPTPLP